MLTRSLTIVTSYPMDEPVVRNRLTPLIDRAVARGFRVRLVSSGTTTLDDDRPGFRHDRLGAVATPQRNFVRRAIDEWRAAKAILQSVRTTPEDIVLVTIPSMFLLFRVGLLSGGRKLLDVRDLTWEYLPDSQPLQRAAKLLFRHLAHGRFGSFDLISCTNERERAYLANKLRIAPSEIVLVPNGIAQSQFDLLAPNGIRRADALEVSYIGNVGVAQNLSILLRAAQMLPKVRFNIVGGGTALTEISMLRKSMALDNVHMTGRIAWDEVRSIYNRTHILYAQLSANFEGAMPSKLYEYLSTGKYVVYGGGGEARKMLARFDNNVVIDPDDPDALVQAIRDAARDGADRRLSLRNREAIEASFIREHASDRLLDRMIEQFNLIA
ncbi:glycosyltransferase [Sphingosinicella sp.]|uniref:glycosyltransferase n=1 Tax=Sphingosinicella sp. TaxID=1917971 RepID=UPI0035B02CA0